MEEKLSDEFKKYEWTGENTLKPEQDIETMELMYVLLSSPPHKV